MLSPVNIAIFEDHAATRKRLVRHVEATGRFCVVSASATLSEARSALHHNPPDILLVDLGLPDGDGCMLIAEQAKANPELPIMVISVFGDEDRVIRAIQAGARGYILKDEDREAIGATLQQLLDGGSPISPSIARHLIRQFSQTRSCGKAVQEPLSARELEVLNLAAKGFTYQEVADLLEVSINTVSSHTKQIYAKLAVNSRSQAVFEAARLGLVNMRTSE